MNGCDGDVSASGPCALIDLRSSSSSSLTLCCWCYYYYFDGQLHDDEERNVEQAKKMLMLMLMSVREIMMVFSIMPVMSRLAHMM